MSTFFKMDCGGEAVTLERTNNGDIIFHGWDEETELAAIELGFEPSACLVVWNAINNDALDDALLYRASRKSALIVEALIFVGASVHEDFVDDWTPLHAAALLDHINIVNVLLKAGASVDTKDNGGVTPLHYATQFGHTDVAKVLLKAGASVDPKDIDGWTPLHQAAANGHTDVVKVILEAGANVDARTEDGRTPLGLASSRSRPVIVEIIEDWIEEHGA